MDNAFYFAGIPTPILIPEWAPAPSYWLRDAFRVLVCLAFGSAILYIQYFRRIPFISHSLLAAGVLLSLLTPRLVPKSKQVALHYLLGSYPACRTVRASFDPRRQNLLRDLRDLDIASATFAIPIRIEGLPAALDPFTPAKPAELWCEGRRVRAVVRESPPGRSWLVLNPDRDPSFFARYARRPVVLDGSLELILFKKTASVSLRARSPVAVPGVGVCGLESAPGNTVDLRCYTPACEAALAVELPGGGRQYLVDRSTVDDYSPTSFQFEPLQKISGLVAVSGASSSRGLQLIAERPVFHFRAHFHIHGIRLADFLLHF